MRLYLSGPISGTKDENRPAFNAEAARLRALGHEVVNPVELHPTTPASWAAAMRVDIRELMGCEGIALMPGWQRSRGATLERYIAESVGIEVFDAADIFSEIAA